MTPAEQSFHDYKSREEWARIVRATDPDTPLHDAAVMDLEEDHAYMSSLVHSVIAEAEAMLREASEG
jgi:hypothetical protein